MEALQNQKDNAPDTLQESFAGLMLRYAAGDSIDMSKILEHIKEDLISVKDYAVQVSS